MDAGHIRRPHRTGRAIEPTIGIALRFEARLIDAPAELRPSASDAAVHRPKRRRPWLDLVLFLLLCLAAFPNRWGETVGDLWYDEADYAQAAVRGFEPNRWDTPDAGPRPN